MAWPLILQLQLSPPRVNNIRGMSLFPAERQADRFDVSLQECHLEQMAKRNKTLGRAQDPRANGAWLSKLTE